MQQDYGAEVTLIRVKRRVKRLKKRFMAFRKFIALPGVRFVEHTSRITIEGEYWANFGPNQKVIRVTLIRVSVVEILVLRHLANYLNC